MADLPFKKDDKGLPFQKEASGLPYQGRRRGRRAEVEEEYEEEEEDEGEQEDLPDTLPPPPSLAASGFPGMAFALGLVASVLAGAVLGLIGQFIYIYIIASIVVAFVISKGMGIGIAQQKSTGRGLLVFLAVDFAIVAFVAYNLTLYLIARERYPQLAALNPFDFFVARAKYATFMGIPLGQIGMLIVWGLELVFTAFLASTMVEDEVNAVEIGMIHPEVLGFLLDLTADGYSEGEIRDLLAERGWSNPTHQEMAFRARNAAIAQALAQQQG